MQTHETVIHAGRLLATPGEAPKRGQSVWIAHGKVKSVTSGFMDPPAGTRLIDLKDKFVLPGLIDCHVHLTPSRGWSRTAASSRRPANPVRC